MKILYLHQYFKTPDDGGAIRSFHIAKAMIAKGYEVEMITSHNQPNKLIQEIDGIKVHYLPVFYENKLGKIARIMAFFKFLWKAYQASKNIENVDLCYATSTPLTIGLLALFLKKKHQIPFVFEVRDLWPLAPIQLGFIKNPFLQDFLFFLEKKLYQHAQKVIVLSKGSFEYVEKIIPSTKIALAPNMSDCDFFDFSYKNPALKQKYHIDNQFVISYLGALGKANHLNYLIEIAKICEKELPQILFLIIGEGAEKEALMEASKKIKNVRFLVSGNKEYIKEILNISDATYTSFLNIPVLQTNSPNKFFDSLAAGKLTIVNTKACLQEIVEENECGFYANPTDAFDFIQKVKTFINDEEKLIRYQKNARKTALNFFNKEKVIEVILRGVL